MIGRSEDLGPAAAMEDVSMEIMRQAVLLQMTWTGAPTIYYGDEAGLGGFTDPDNRRTYPWGRENHGLIRCHKALAAFRKNSAALRRGSIMRLSDEDGVLAYARTIKKDGRRETNIILLNINHIKIHYETNVSYAGVPTEANLVDPPGRNPGKSAGKSARHPDPGQTIHQLRQNPLRQNPLRQLRLRRQNMPCQIHPHRQICQQKQTSRQ